MNSLVAGVILGILLCIFSMLIVKTYNYLGGYKMIIGRFYPLTWEQDLDLKNGGKDIVSFGVTHKGYFHGTVQEHEKFMNEMLGYK